MLPFKDRHEAGQRLSTALKHYQGATDCIVIGLPRGGVVTAYEVAKALQLPLDVICPRKIGAPQNHELAIGAITESGDGIFDESLIQRLRIPQSYIEKTVEREKQVARHRANLFRKGKPKVDVTGKTVIVIDDGLATGATMRAAIKSLLAEKPKKIIVAVPVAPFDTVQMIQTEVNEVICLECPSFFQAVGEFYEDFSQTQDEEVIALLGSSAIV